MKKSLFLVILITLFALGLNAQNANSKIGTDEKTNVSMKSPNEALYMLKEFKDFFTTQGMEEKELGNFKKEDIKVFPNPASENINIKLTGDGYAKATLYDLPGREFFSETFEKELKIAVSDFDVGLYFLKVNEYVYRIIIKK